MVVQCKYRSIIIFSSSTLIKKCVLVYMDIVFEVQLFCLQLIINNLYSFKIQCLIFQNFVQSEALTVYVVSNVEIKILRPNGFPSGLISISLLYKTLFCSLSDFPPKVFQVQITNQDDIFLTWHNGRFILIESVRIWKQRATIIIKDDI